jgi:hypothetical protein
MSPLWNSGILNLSIVGSLSHGLSFRKRLLFGIGLFSEFEFVLFDSKF